MSKRRRVFGRRQETIFVKLYYFPILSNRIISCQPNCCTISTFFMFTLIALVNMQLLSVWHLKGRSLSNSDVNLRVRPLWIDDSYAAG